MSLLGLKQREKGSNKQDTKAMSLRTRYYLKSEDGDAGDTEGPLQWNELRRDTLVVVKRNTGLKEELCYRVLGVFKQYNNKWFLQKPSEAPPQWQEGQAAPKIRLSLRLLERETFGTQHVWCPVRTYRSYAASDVHRSIKADAIVRIEGYLS
jgi:hypothetical protein